MASFRYHKFFIAAAVFIFILFPNYEVLALMKSKGYEIEPYVQDEGGGPTGSDNYDAVTSVGEIGEGFEGKKQDLGSGYPPMLGKEGILIVKALPEKRRPPVGIGHEKTHLKLEIVKNGVAQYSALADTDDITGEATYNIDLETFGGGPFDVGARGYSHLRRVKRNVNISDTSNYIDMSNGETTYLFAGDANGAEGDNTVNSLDIGAVVDYYHTPFERTDFNLEGDTNSIDLGILIDNYHKLGDQF